jgi:hypothetical protein
MMYYASAILLTATLMLWVLSYLGEDVVTVTRRSKTGPQWLCVDWLQSNWGEINLHRFTIGESEWGQSGGYPAVRYAGTPSSRPENPKERWGMYWHCRINWHEESIYICFPHWGVAMAFSILPTVRVVGYLRRRRRFGAGRCSSCGYDLRATPDRCPECGATPLKQ